MVTGAPQLTILGLAHPGSPHTVRWARSLTERGHRVALVATEEFGPEHQKRLGRVGCSVEGSVGLVHVRDPSVTARHLRTIRRAVKVIRPDVLHCHYLGPGSWYGAMCGFKPMVVSVMGADIIGEAWQPRNATERFLSPFTLRRADRVTAWSPGLARVVETVTPLRHPVEVLHGGVDTARFQPGPCSQGLHQALELPADSRVVLSPRLMRPLYNIDTIVRAAHTVCREADDVHFVVIVPEPGRESQYEDLVRQVASAGHAAGRVHFVSSVPHGEIHDFFRLADVTVSIPDADGTPLSVLESLACGTPAVVGRGPSFDRRYIEDGRTVVFADRKNPESLGKAISSVLTSDDKGSSLAEEGRRRVVASGSVAAQTSLLERIYASLVAGHGVPR